MAKSKNNVFYENISNSPIINPLANLSKQTHKQKPKNFDKIKDLFKGLQKWTDKLKYFNNNMAQYDLYHAEKYDDLQSKIKIRNDLISEQKSQIDELNRQLQKALLMIGEQKKEFAYYKNTIAELEIQKKGLEELYNDHIKELQQHNAEIVLKYEKLLNESDQIKNIKDLREQIKNKKNSLNREKKKQIINRLHKGIATHKN